MKPVISDIVIKSLQNKYFKAYGGQPNTFEPACESKLHPFEGGSVHNEVRFSTQWPNSFVDIFYGDTDTEVRPTVIYLHGGGWFMGGRSGGDPLTGPGATKSIASQNILLVKAGFNVVSIDYCLSPQYRFPEQVLQINAGLGWLRQNAGKLRLNMNKVLIFGGSAGAVLTAMIGCAYSNPEYAKAIRLTPAIPRESICGLCVDGAPIIAEKFDWGVRTMCRSWIGQHDLFGKNGKLVNVCSYVVLGYPTTFLTAGNDGCFMEHTKPLAEVIRKTGGEAEEFYPDIAVSHEGHGYLGNWETSSEAKRGMDALVAFMHRVTGDSHGN